MKTILLKLAGPMQSYGTSSHFETRATDPHPSKSAMIGMVAAALGYRRDETEKIRRLNQLMFAVRTDHEGELLRDYHTVEKNRKLEKKDSTYVTNRYYLEDAVFVVALGSEDNELIEQIRQALRSPYFQPYLGRRSLPPTYDFLLDTVEGGPIEALKHYPLQGPRSVMDHKTVTLYGDLELLPSKASNLRNDYVQSFDPRGRTFGFRGEGSMEIQLKENEHDAFGAL
ncbi:type I-E CRISPR-associated protein Cas5/CasD [Aedoeadaptatus coxii]|uniref:CRISPR system CASCADE complex protein CasD n=1 Tax=Aedoeadaptatus coxii TaxID=755172 RepID=A0A134ALG2_9FIRM|nr:type I-E CRISPR-associated protein Cas5/CasD [Peptoniphilus coxii]KXB68535.1 CRISPR system CASCADE complex protein CasD [Peptoniphilus coxii]